MRDQSDDPSHNECMLYHRAYSKLLLDGCWEKMFTVKQMICYFYLLIMALDIMVKDYKARD